MLASSCEQFTSPCEFPLFFFASRRKACAQNLSNNVKSLRISPLSISCGWKSKLTATLQRSEGNPAVRIHPLLRAPKSQKTLRAGRLGLVRRTTTIVRPFRKTPTVERTPPARPRCRQALAVLRSPGHRARHCRCQPSSSSARDSLPGTRATSPRMPRDGAKRPSRALNTARTRREAGARGPCSPATK
jgi:hypothetical protein